MWFVLCHALTNHLSHRQRRRGKPSSYSSSERENKNAKEKIRRDEKRRGKRKYFTKIFLENQNQKLRKRKLKKWIDWLIRRRQKAKKYSYSFFLEMRTRDVRILDSIAREKRNERWVASLNRDNFQVSQFWNK